MVTIFLVPSTTLITEPSFKPSIDLSSANRKVSALIAASNIHIKCLSFQARFLLDINGRIQRYSAIQRPI
ncbi:hypothetical protein BpHYR1_026295 [Brachionus plicatilis]|uniref:Uncharacterized protein n=1 Tax=Brachionus plicatilis TaxID=10195 RepID=A0A3M7QAD5_BRAPC|nr:hypothetical protein BpHYR1_026295 [Brachionus plicatilis]